jgi:PAS domain S-box-containing protein
MLELDAAGRIQGANTLAIALLGVSAAAGQPLAHALGLDAAGLAAALVAADPVWSEHCDRWLLLHAGPLLDDVRLVRVEAVGSQAQARPSELPDPAQDGGHAGTSRALTDMESQLALAEGLAHLVVWRHDLAQGLVHFNRPGLALFGLPPKASALPLDAVRALIHPDDHASVLASARDTLALGEATDVSARYRHADGSWRSMLTRRVLQRDEHGVPIAFLGVALDVTASAEASRRALELAQRFDLATGTAGIGYWAREGDAERATWSAQMRSLHGLGPDDLVPTLKEWLADFVHPQDRTAMQAEFRRWLGGEAPQARAEVRIVRRDGGVRHLLTHSRMERGGDEPVLFGIAVDVTEQRLADMALRRADERALLAARGAGIGTWEVEWPSGICHWDTQMWLLRGLPEGARPPDPQALMALVHPDDRAAAWQRMRQDTRSSDTVEHTFRVVWPDGRVRWLASRSGAVHDDQGQVVRRIGVNWDVTDARLADAERRERETAEQANRAKSQFIARMSHELRTPLNAVLGFTQLLIADEARGGADAGQRGQRLAHIAAAGQHLLTLITDVLDLASLDVGELRITPVPVPLAAMVADTLPLLEPLRSEHDIDIDVQVPDLTLLADPTRLRQVLLNLLSNAIKYNHRGGRVDLRATADADRVVLLVSDSGRGMSDLQLRELFQPFNRLGLEGAGIEGTGIGLAIVKALVERMGGQVEVLSAPGQGSRFKVSLPRAQSAHAAADVAALPSATDRARPQAARRSVLYIEDNAVNMLIVGELLSGRSDIELHTAADGASGLAAARALQPALVLLDMHLPDMDGLAVLQQLRADPLTAALPCVALSANALPDDIARALAAGMADYWTKPLDLEAFLAGLDRLLAA